ncbi:MAG: GNAT family N-acetyltransferase [Bacillota bacterium]
MVVQPSPVVQAATEDATVEVIRDVEPWQRLRPEWDELFQASPTASPPLRFDWLWHWWRIYGPAYGNHGQGLRILTFRRQSRLIGVVPLYEMIKRSWGVPVRRLGFISTGEAEFEETCADYLDLLHLPGEREMCMEALVSALCDRRTLAWDELELFDMSGRSPLIDLHGRLRGCQTSLASSDTCPIANIAGGLEAFLERLSANTRQQARRRLRMAQKAGAILERAMDSSEVDPYFDDLIRLHQQRWNAIGQPGVFASSRFTELHRTLARSWVPTGKAILVRLSLDGQAMAVIYGFLVGTKFDFYQSGVAIDEPSGLQSPGMVAFLMLKAHLAERGITQFDFLRGASPYKQRLATDYCPMIRLCAVRPGVRTRVFAISNFVRRLASKSRRVLRAATVV